MSIPKPYSGPSAVRLTAVINEDNDTDLKLGVDFYFGSPSFYLLDSERNTKVTLYPAEGSIYTQSEEVHYERLTLDVLNNLPEDFIFEVELPALPTSIHQILERINEALGLDLSTNEVQDTPITEIAGTHPLRIINSVSLAWIDSNYHFKAKPVPLDSVISQKILLGLDYNDT